MTAGLRTHAGHGKADIVTNNGQRAVAYANTSTSLKVYDDGYAALQNGQSAVSFSPEFLALMTPSKRPVITVTAVGAPVALYIRSIDKNGFSVAAADGSAANVEFSWTAVAKRVDAAKAEVPAQIMDAQFDEHLKGAMFNDGNTGTKRQADLVGWLETALRCSTGTESRKQSRTETLIGLMKGWMFGIFLVCRAFPMPLSGAKRLSAVARLENGCFLPRFR